MALPTHQDNDALQSVPLLHSAASLPTSSLRISAAVDSWGSTVKQLLHQDSPHSSAVGMVLYAVATAFVALMGTCAKLLGARGLPVFEVILARGLLMVLFTAPVLINSGADPRGQRRLLLLLRGTLGFGSVSSMFWALNMLPLSDATVLSFLAPVFVALTAPVLLNEPPSRVVLLSLPVCLVGVVLVARPSAIFGGHTLSTLGVLVGIMQAGFSATAKMSVRELRRTEPDAVIVFWMASLNALGAALFCLILPHRLRVPSGAYEWLLLLGTGVAGYGNQVTLTMALRRCAATPALAMSYLSVLWGLLLGSLLFHEHPTWSSMLGACLICASTLTLSLFQASMARAKAAKAAASSGGTSSSTSTAPGGGGGLLGQPGAAEGAAAGVGGGVLEKQGGTEMVEVVVPTLQRRPTAGHVLPVLAGAGLARVSTSEEAQIAAHH